MKKFASVGTARCFIVIDIRRDRESDEERKFIRIVICQFDADGESLDDLDEVAGCVLGGKKSQRLSGPHRESGDPSLEGLVLAVHIDLTINPLTDSKIVKLGLFEVRVDPDFC